eukprot:3813572-Pyramimonas_sp.AAC.1
MLQGQLDLLNALVTQVNPAEFKERCTTVLATLMNQIARTQQIQPQQAARCTHLVAASQLDGPSRAQL